MKKDSSLAWERRGRNQEMNVLFIDINQMKEFFPSVDQKVQDTWGDAAKAIKVDKKIFQGIAPLPLQREPEPFTDLFLLWIRWAVR